jgi:hypothetical protein
MATALYQYLGILTVLDCSAETIYAGLLGVVAGMALSAIVGLLKRKNKP